MAKRIELYTDGACSGNPGPGGWGAVLRYGTREKELSGGEKSTTNNRMELTAVIKGLEALKEPCEVRLVTDSKYVADGLSKGWARSWQQNGWRKADKKPALNPDLWERLLQLSDIHKLDIEWVKGHAGHPENERCDRLAVEYYKKFTDQSVNTSDYSKKKNKLYNNGGAYSRGLCCAYIFKQYFFTGLRTDTVKGV